MGPSGGSLINVGGRLLAQGTVEDPIVFTSYRDDVIDGHDTNGDGTSSGSAGDWDELRLTGAGSRLEHCVVRYGGYAGSSYDHQLWIRLSRETEFLHHPQVWAVSRYHQDAKNVTMASECGAEVIKIMDWAENEPDLALIIQNNYHPVWAGAYQMIARYLLDGGKPGEAFRNYYKAARTWPPSLRFFWHRFLFSALKSLGLGFIGKWYYYLKNRRKPGILDEESLKNWPGLTSHENNPKDSSGK